MGGGSLLHGLCPPCIQGPLCVQNWCMLHTSKKVVLEAGYQTSVTHNSLLLVGRQKKKRCSSVLYSSQKTAQGEWLSASSTQNVLRAVHNPACWQWVTHWPQASAIAHKLLCAELINRPKIFLTPVPVFQFFLIPVSGLCKSQEFCLESCFFWIRSRAWTNYLLGL